MEIFLAVILVVLAVVAAAGVKVVPQSQVYIVERFGKYDRLLRPGLNLIIPFVQVAAHKVSVLERQLASVKIGVITSDNVAIDLVATVFYRVTDGAKAVYRINDVNGALTTSLTGIVRSAAGRMEFDDVQSRRAEIGQEILTSLQRASEEWGIEITRSEVLDVIIDSVTRTAIQQQLNAERERRARVRRAEGEKQAAQLNADAELYTAQRKAEARREIANAEAYATQVIANAIADGGQPAIDYELMRSQISAVSNMGTSRSTKLLVLPANVTETLGSLAALKEVISDHKLDTAAQMARKGAAQASKGASRHPRTRVSVTPKAPRPSTSGPV